MRALQLESYDGPGALRIAELPDPAVGAEEALVEVRAIGVNFPDLLITQGAYQHKPQTPFVPGCEIAGQVVEAPAGSGWSKGDPVAAFVWSGGYAERVAVPLAALTPLPAGADFLTGAAMVVNYHTTYFALARRGRLRSGEKLLVLGAGGGIGTAAIQVGVGLGATVIGGVADAEQAKIARAAGAAETLILAEGFAARVKEMVGGRGVDVVLDPLGDWIFAEALRALAPEGRALVVGFAAGGIPEIKTNRLLLRNIEAVGVGWGAFLDLDPEIVPEASKALGEMYAAGAIRPQVGARYAFEELPAALERLGRGEIPGKAVAELG
jgi:NADPH2:quinone reductase